MKTKAPTKVRISVIKAVNGEWFVRIKRSGRIIYNTETYIRKANAEGLAKRWAKLIPGSIIES